MEDFIGSSLHDTNARHFWRFPTQSLTYSYLLKFVNHMVIHYKVTPEELTGIPT